MTIWLISGEIQSSLYSSALWITGELQEEGKNGGLAF
jgi:hypothetical protein